MQEQARKLGHINLVLSQLPIDVFQELQMSVMQEMNSRAENISNELVKVTTESVGLDMEYKMETLLFLTMDYLTKVFGGGD
jgi:hypothetical protein